MNETEILARFAATLRAGRIVELASDTPHQRVVRSLTRFRIGPDKIDGELCFQLEIETTSRSGRTSTSRFNYCDWTAQDVYSQLREYEQHELNLISIEEAETDAIAQQIIKASCQPVSFGAYSFKYHPGDDALLVCGEPGVGDIPMTNVHHQFDDIITRDLSPAQRNTLRLATNR